MRILRMATSCAMTAPVIADVSAELARRFPRVAVTHEWLTIPGGSEQVVARILELLPHAEVFTSVYDPAPWPPIFTERQVHTSFLDRLPRARRLYPKLLPLMDAAFRSFDLRGFDLVISSNHACAKNVRTPPGALHLCYCHTPMRYAWEPRFLAGETLGPVGRLVAPALLAHLRRQDARAARAPDAIAANSRHVAQRVERFWGRAAEVVHPPVDVGRFLSRPHAAGDYYLFLGRLVPYKRADLAVAACRILGRPLKIVGAGRSEAALDIDGEPGIELLGHLSDGELAEVLSGARGLLFPGEEDFGIVPVEAMAAGVPVVAYGRGGARDSVVDGRTGVLFAEQTPEALAAAIVRLESLALDEREIRAHAATFSPDRFRREFAAFALRAAAARDAH